MANWRSGKPTPTSSTKRDKLEARASAPAGTSSREKVSWKQKRTGAEAAPRAFWVSGGGRRSRWRGMALFISGLGIVALGALFSIQILRGDKPTPCIVITGLNFDSPWMPNAWAKEDADRLASWFNAKENEQSLQCFVHQEGKNGRWDSILEQQLNLAKPGGPGGNLIFWKYSSLVIYLSAHGVLNEGRPCLAFSKETLVDFEEVLKLIIDHPQQQNTRLLLVIDPGRQLPDARLTVFQEEFLAAAKQIVESQTRKHLAVLFAADEEQIAWDAPELNGTVFGTFFARGFLGQADASRNKRLTVREIAKYVGSRVANYAQRTRAAPQTPVLAWSQGRENDFEISYCDFEASKAIEPAADVDATKLSDLKGAWDEFEAWRSKVLRIDPWRVAQVRDELSYADQLVWAGTAYATQANESIALARRHMQSPLQRRTNLTGSSRFLGKPPAPVFNLGELAEPSDEPAANATTKSSGDQTDKAVASAAPPAEPKAKPTFADLARQWLAQPKTAEGKDVEPPKTKDFQEYIAFAWWWLKQNEPSHWSAASLANLQKLRPEEPLSPQSLRAEDALIFAVFEDVNAMAEVWDSGDPAVDERWPALMTMLEEVDRNVMKSLELDARVLNTARGAIEKLFIKLRVMRDQLHARRLPEDVATEGVQEISAVLDDAIERWRTLDEFADELPLMIEWPLTARMVADIQSSIDLCAASTAEGSDAWTRLRDAHERLRGEYSQQVHSLAEERESSSPESFQKVQMHLDHRPIQAGERSQLHEKLRSHFRTLAASRLEELSGDAESTEQSFEPLNIPESLLKSFAALSKQVLSSDPGLGLRKSWREFVGSIRGSQGWWSEELPADREQFRDNARKVRLCTNLAPRASTSAAMQLPPLFDAARLEEELAWHDYLLWRANNFLVDFWRTPQESIGADEPYFALCANAFINEAADLEHAPKAARDATRAQLQQFVELSNQWFNLLDESDPQTNSDSKSVAVDWLSTPYPVGMARISVRSRRLGEEQTKLKEAIEVGKGTKSNRVEAQLQGAETARLIADYRGHRSVAQFAFAKSRARWTLANNLRVDEKTNVTVRSAPQAVEIVFALDCSGSFNPKDFDTAKDALLQAVIELEGRELLKIGLVVFGHSRNFPDTKEPEKNVDWDTAFPGLSGPHFYNDVVVLENLAPATLAQRNRIEGYLKQLKPFGTTPLFWATEVSKGLLDASYQSDPTKTVHRRVIVLTDGENNVVPTLDGKPLPRIEKYRKYFPPPEFDRTAEQVRKAFLRPGAKVSLDVIQLGGGNNAAMRALAEEFGGKFRNANFEDLARDLSETLNPLRFTITELRGRRDSDRLALFNTQWPLTSLPLDGSAKEYRIIITSERNEVASKEVTVFAGDNLHVNYDPRQKVFTFPFEAEERLPLRLGDGLLAWRIKSRPNSRDIRFVFDQQDRTQQTIRPALAFMEVSSQPLAQLSAGGAVDPKVAFWTSDVIWESRTQRPTCLTSIEQGPDMTDAALPVRLWVRNSLPSKEGAVTLQSIGASSQSELRDIGGVKVTIKGATVASGYQLEVTTLPASESRLIVIPPRAEAVEHQFFADGQVVYKYFYSEKPSGSVDFYKAPSDSIATSDSQWRSTGWVETER